jgi:hypothetical protein
VPFLINEGSFSKASTPPFFLEDETIFQKSALVVLRGIALGLLVEPREPIFKKCSHLREKAWEKGGVMIFFRVCMVGCMCRISHTNLKNRMVISGIATPKNHIELLVPGQIWDRIRDPGRILV